MAEAIGLAASVIAVSQTAWAVAKGLYDLADEVGSAGEAVQIFANDFALFVENLKELGALLDSSPSVSRQTQSVTEDLLEVAADQIVQLFQRLLQDLQPLLVTWRDSPSRMKQLGASGELLVTRPSPVLSRCSQCTEGQCVTSTTGHGSQRPNSASYLLVNHQILVFLPVLLVLLYSILRGSIESTKAALPGNARKPTPRLLQSGQVIIEDRSMTKPTLATFATSLSIIDTAPNGRPVSDDQHPHSVEAGTVVVTDVNDPDDADSAGSSQAFAEISLLADEVPEDQDDNREEQMELSGAIRTMQRKIVRLADEAVAASGPIVRQDR